MPLLFEAALLNCSALRFSSLPSRCRSTRFASALSLGFAILCDSAAQHCPSTCAPPSRYISGPCYSVARQRLSKLFLCLACLRNSFAVQLQAVPFLCFSDRCYAIPSQVYSAHSFALALPSIALPSLCDSWLLTAFPSHSAARPSFALPQISSSQVNRPLPEFRHWPRPRSAP